MIQTFSMLNLYNSSCDIFLGFMLPIVGNLAVDRLEAGLAEVSRSGLSSHVSVVLDVLDVSLMAIILILLAK